PPTVTDARIFTVLDDKGIPLHTPPERQIDWREPFVAREIHETLPRWQAAAYLADPDFIATKAEATTSVLWVLTAFLLFAVAGGGVVMTALLGSELALARKKTDLVTNVSHELKTPLTSIRLFAEMLMADIAPSATKRKEYCTLLVSETERLSRLINNVLDFSKSSQGKKQYRKTKLDLVSLIRQTVSCEELRLKQKGITLRFRSRYKKVEFTGCRESLIQVLVNLISNAEKYAASGKMIEIMLRKEKDTIVLETADRGPGVPAWAVKKIFQEFYRVDDSLTQNAGGSGLGLTIARMIVTDHGGQIDYQPRPGGGSLFRITFPDNKEEHSHGA
ncbi:MAG TPA: HAMP domain-containing histidine kinase, partial [Spirochaetia bacterium]|nr:HAMP domain-containing histidine kinase [Spirochaetia bacterium]